MPSVVAAVPEPTRSILNALPRASATEGLMRRDSLIALMRARSACSPSINWVAKFHVTATARSIFNAVCDCRNFAAPDGIHADPDWLYTFASWFPPEVLMELRHEAGLPPRPGAQTPKTDEERVAYARGFNWPAIEARFIEWGWWRPSDWELAQAREAIAARPPPAPPQALHTHAEIESLRAEIATLQETVSALQERARKQEAWIQEFYDRWQQWFVPSLRDIR